jgi:hypothetical protein
MAAPCCEFSSSHCAPPCSPHLQFSAFVAAETANWGKLIREVGVRAD